MQDLKGKQENETRSQRNQRGNLKKMKGNAYAGEQNQEADLKLVGQESGREERILRMVWKLELERVCPGNSNEREWTQKRQWRKERDSATYTQ